MSDAHIPVLRDVVHTDELPVEVDCEHEIRAWHDDAGTLRICELVPVDEHEVE